MLGYLGGAWWRFLPPATRGRERGAASRSSCCSGLDAAKTASQKAAWFGALRNVAIDAGDGRLAARACGNKKETVPGLPLAEADYTALALELAVREVPDWREHPRRRSSRASRIPIARRASSSSCRRSRPIRRSASAGSWRSRTSPTAAASRGCSRGSSYLHHPLRAARVGEVRPPEPGAAVGDPADRRHLLPEALDGRDARRPPVAEVARRCATFSNAAAGRIRARLRNIVLQSADELFRATGGVQP